MSTALRSGRGYGRYAFAIPLFADYIRRRWIAWGHGTLEDARWYPYFTKSFSRKTRQAMKRSAVRIAILAIVLAMLPCVAQGQTWGGTTGGVIDDHDQREEAERKKVRAARPATYTTLARAVRNDSRNAAEYDALAVQARASSAEALQHAEKARRLAVEASYMARIETPDRWWGIVEAQERAAEIWEQEAALWETGGEGMGSRCRERRHDSRSAAPVSPCESAWIRPSGSRSRNPHRSELCAKVAIR